VNYFLPPQPRSLFPPSTASTLHEFADCLLDAVVFTLDPLNNPSSLRICIRFNSSDLGPDPVPCLISSPFPLVTTRYRSSFVCLSTALCLFLSLLMPDTLVAALRLDSPKGNSKIHSLCSYPSEHKCGPSRMNEFPQRHIHILCVVCCCVVMTLGL
jgi:hypothetical protein